MLLWAGTIVGVRYETRTRGVLKLGGERMKQGAV